MLKFSTSLPHGRRLDVYVTKKRPKGHNGEPLIPTLAKLRRIRRGNKFSRVIRHVFEHKNVKRILASHLALASVFLSIFAPTTQFASEIEPEQGILVQDEANMLTKRTVANPVKNMIISQGYHFFHPAIDIDGLTGEPINPIMDGVVVAISYSRLAYGNAILIDHKNGYRSLYAHLSKIEVVEGDSVTTFNEIGKMGSTGHAFGDHLHLEVYKNVKNINPSTILPLR